MDKRTIVVAIKEELNTLDVLYRKSKNYRIKKRIKSLMLTKSNKFETREGIAKHLGINVKTLYVWTKIYQEEGLDAMLTISSGGKRREIVSQEIKEALEKKLNDSTSPLHGYTDAIHWVKKEFGITFHYNTLRTFMMTNFKTKLKQPRKSHYKKDEKAFEAFKKKSIKSSS